MNKYYVFFLLLISNVFALDPSYKFEGILGAPDNVLNNKNHYSSYFIPYNAVVVEIGAYLGQGTISLAHSYPYGSVYAFEPHPESYIELEKRIGGIPNAQTINAAVGTVNGEQLLCENGVHSTLIKSKKCTKQIKVHCVRLDDWCVNNRIDHIDFLRLDTNGTELDILLSAPKIIETVQVLVLKTYLRQPNHLVPSYNTLKQTLTTMGFELLAHWYQEGKRGEAVFIRKHLYDSIFR